MKGYVKSAHHVSVHGPRGVHPKGGPQPPFVWSVSRRGDFQGEREIEIPLPLNGIFPPFLPWKKAVAPQRETSRQGQSPCPTVSPGATTRRAARMSPHPYSVQTNKNIPRRVHAGGCFCAYSSSFLVEAMNSSSSCFCSTKLGAPASSQVPYPSLPPGRRKLAHFTARPFPNTTASLGRVGGP